MVENVARYQCPACGAPLRFDESSQKLSCDSCGSSFEQNVINQQTTQTPQNNDSPQTRIDWNVEGYMNHQETSDAPGFMCESCGAEIVSDGQTVATECMYCGNPVLISSRVEAVKTPDLVIPFKITKEQAEQKLRNFYNGKKLLPSAFTKGNRVSKITGMYVPFWLFTCSGSGQVTYDAKKVDRWSDDDYEYERTKTYKVERAGSIAFDKISVDASTKMEDDYMDGLEPYDYSEAVPFSSMYLAGYFADKFDVNVSESSIRANDRVINSTKQAFEDTVKGYTSFHEDFANINMHGEDIHYALLPVWMLNTKYEGKMYGFAINGQTGQVSGELPIDNFKLWMWRLGITIGTAIPVATVAAWLLA